MFAHQNLLGGISSLHGQFGNEESQIPFTINVGHWKGQNVSCLDFCPPDGSEMQRAGMGGQGRAGRSQDRYTILATDVIGNNKCFLLELGEGVVVQANNQQLGLNIKIVRLHPRPVCQSFFVFEQRQRSARHGVCVLIHPTF